MPLVSLGSAANADGEDTTQETEKTRLKNKHNTRERLVLVLPESVAFSVVLFAFYWNTKNRAVLATARTTREMCASIPTHRVRQPWLHAQVRG